MELQSNKTGYTSLIKTALHLSHFLITLTKHFIIQNQKTL